jgi:hypothetical protein
MPPGRIGRVFSIGLLRWEARGRAAVKSARELFLELGCGWILVYIQIRLV